MTILSLDLSRIERDQGLSKIVKVAGNPFLASPSRLPDFTTTRIPIGNADGYDVSSCNSIRLFYDINLSGAGLLILHIVSGASNLGEQKEPVPAGANAFFLQDIISLTAAAGPVRPVRGSLEFVADRRGSLLMFRPGPHVRFEVETDTPSPTGEIALAVQGQQGRE